MKIDYINFNEKNMNFILELSNQEELKVSYEVYEKYELKKSMELSDKLYELLKEEDAFIKAKEIALRFVSYKPRTVFELERKLHLNKISQTNIDKTIEYLTKIGYLNDRNYAEEFFRQCIELKNYSLKKTKVKFYEKGIDKYILEDIISKKYSDDYEYENAMILGKKKAKNLDLNDLKAFEKAYRYLVSNGFSYSIAKEVLEEIKNEED